MTVSPDESRRTRKSKPIRLKSIWLMGNLDIWDSVTNRKPPPIDNCTVVVHSPNHLGDTIMSIPLVTSLRQQTPFPLTVVTREEYSPIWTRVDRRLKVIKYEGWTREEKSRLRRILKNNRYDVAFLLATGTEVAWLYARAGVRHRLGYDYWGRGCLLTARLKSSGEPSSSSLVAEHHSGNMLRLLDLVDTMDCPPQPLRTLECTRTAAAAKVKGEEVLGVVLGGNTPDKMFSEDFWTAVIDMARIQTGAGTVYLFGTDNHLPLGVALSRDSNSMTNLCGQTDIESLMTYLSKCGVVIGPDSGTVHLASALGVATVVLFTSGAPQWTKPLGAPTVVVQSGVECAPCFHRSKCSHYRCTGAIHVAAVAKGLRALTKGFGPRQSNLTREAIVRRFSESE